MFRESCFNDDAAKKFFNKHSIHQIIFHNNWNGGVKERRRDEMRGDLSIMYSKKNQYKIEYRIKNMNKSIKP